ncbi:MAG: metalloregulator ArsR/SmtB family transcription factor [Phycisphaerales bacterium]
MTQVNKRLRADSKAATRRGARDAKRPADAGRTAKTSRPATPRHAASRRAPIDSLLNPDLFRALCDPTRAALVACIAKCGRGCSVSEVAQCCSVDLSVVSRHLALLADAGVLESRKQGRTVYYAVRYAELVTLLRSLADAFHECCPGGCGQDGGCCGSP